MAEEKRFETKVKNFLESQGAYFVKFFANSYTKKGVPDVLACVGGYFVGIEVKAQNGHASELQIHLSYILVVTKNLRNLLNN